MKYLALIAFMLWSAFVFRQGYDKCKLEFVEAQKEQYEATITNLIAARNEVAEQAKHYRELADGVRADAERMQRELRAAQARARDQRTAPGQDTGRRSTEMGAILERATALIKERDLIALQYNELREQCRLR